MKQTAVSARLSQTPHATIEDGRIIAEVGSTVWIPIEFFVPNPNQPRKWFDPEELTATAKSYKHLGDVEEAVKVTLRDDGRIALIIDGESRWRAALLPAAGLSGLSAFIKPAMSDDEVYRSSAVANTRRKEFSVIERALTIFEFQQRFNLDQNAAGVELGYEPTAVSYLMPFLDLHEKIQQLVMQNKLGAGVARQLAKFNINDQLRMLKAIKDAVVENGNKPIHPNKVARILRGTAEKKKITPKKATRGRDHSTHAQLVSRNLLNHAKNLLDALREFSQLSQPTIKELENPHFLDIERALLSVTKAARTQIERLSRQA
ncbi:MAG: ParB-like protein partition protein [Candidatus Wolfebacteria bacterium GW2011_GWE1_48_7]|uniref:ParB-like protein partition protein, chromosome partitioning protein, ParB family n=1 Tax=Candidatus Wolfebacteria bacterium GW2011_GWB1_47_1 TaxID=1619007 RepID=A0A0G4AVL6_9BACT|nr:MAG: parB-like protein partition protein, chromosome partitioning protein, ParB family [Candidatus Wolfebacteria bacterium GW2011_GWB1_47_1]KKU35168.1 MAG: ParB-like protein partition protein [Candidatus Wolfebacteria bacterium GW2011_GWC2_46_275]KKU41447.1 MAG: ParB-like protein partition protein [Candidatus Wolfebacteria bacterium GW2011_GWB2_46_69]KKU53473.1 MAG: ParB-like protein partition protein [Candidatus Wolfebacteria bacterium GW2011_GWC1_47_103]KKU58847.1 MAG: ParB-like protein pa